MQGVQAGLDAILIYPMLLILVKFLVKNSQIINQNLVQEHFNNTLFIRTKNIESRGWILDIMMCIDSISKDTFEPKRYL